MSNLDNIIADIKEVNQTYDFWIRDEDGNIKDDVICAEIIPFLEDLKDYELDMTQEEIENFRVDNYDRLEFNNTYNNNANIDHDFEFDILNDDMNNEVIVCIMVHRYGDVRGNYTDWAICKFNNMYEFFELESTTPSLEINEQYVADLCIFDETYHVWDYVNDNDIGYFYHIEKEDLLKAIADEPIGI